MYVIVIRGFEYVTTETVEEAEKVCLKFLKEGIFSEIWRKVDRELLEELIKPSEYEDFTIFNLKCVKFFEPVHSFVE